MWINKDKLMDLPNVKINKTVNQHQYLMERAEDILTLEYEKTWSEWQMLGVSNVSVMPVTHVNLGERKMKGTTLAYKFLGNVDKVLKNPGQCVIDYLVYECQTHDRMKHWTREKLIKYFGKAAIVKGISTKEIIQWAKDNNYVNVFAMDPFMETFVTHTCSTTTSYMSLCFIVNNDHCYAILDQKYKLEIARKHRIDLGDFMFNVKYNDYEYIKTKNMFLILQKIRDTQKQIILIEKDDLCEIASELMVETESMMINVKFSGSKLLALEHPVTKQIIISAEEHDLRKKICDDIFEEIECEQFKFKINHGHK
jgi:hypothetical protein